MSDYLALAEKKKYDDLWKHVPSYRSVSPAEALAPFYLKTFGHWLQSGETMLDFGCGTGRAAKFFLSANLRVELIDFASNCLDDEIVRLTRLRADRCRFWECCLWDLPEALPTGEWGFCCDVMEHIPPGKVDRVLASIASRVTKGALFSIFLTEDGFGLGIGQPLHLTLQPKEWWQEALERYFPTVNLLIESTDWVVFQILKQ